MNKIFLAAALALYASALPVLAGDAVAGQQKAAVCAACHGADGNSTDPQYPNLAGQSARYLGKQLRDFRGQIRVNALMQGLAAPLSDQDIEDLSDYYASLPLAGGAADPELVDAGQALYRGGDPSRDIPACTACHGPTGKGIPDASYPALGGQHADYTAAQLQAFRSMERSNDAQRVMRGVVTRMTDADIRAVASYVQGLQE